MPHQQPRNCMQCPHNAQPDPNNPAICTWKPFAVAHMSPERQQVVRIVRRLHHNDQVTWCSHDLKFRLLIVRAVLVAIRAQAAEPNLEVRIYADKQAA